MTTRPRMLRPIIALLLLLIAAIAPLHAQTFRGGINGTVVDGTGVVVPTATVTIVNVDTAATKTAEVTGSGAFLF